jgi:hypothetical protein
MNPLRKVAMWNMIILLIYSIVIFSLIFLPDRSSDHMIGLGFMIMMMFAVAIHATINLFIAIFLFARATDNDLAKAFLASSGLVLVVGFSTCWGGAGLGGGI